MVPPHETLLTMLLDKDQITWQTLIQELVRSEEMDPWDVDVSILTRRYLEMLKKLKELDFSMSGKVVLAAAILLKLKSTRLIGEDINELDRLMAPPEEEEAFYDEIEQELHGVGRREDVHQLRPRTPQPRRRKVSIYDLMGALNKALEVKERRIVRLTPSVTMEAPKKAIDVSALITDLHTRVMDWLKTHEKITFKELLKSDNKEEKVLTLIPLLHLAHIDQRKINLVQHEAFGEINIEPNKPEAVPAGP